MSKKSKELFKDLDGYLKRLDKLYFDMGFCLMSISSGLSYLQDITSVQKDEIEEPYDIVLKDMDDTVNGIFSDYDHYTFLARDNLLDMYELNVWIKEIFKETGHNYQEIKYPFWNCIEIEDLDGDQE